MAPKIEEDWSDSDDEMRAEMETSVLLGVPDGSISSVTDIADAAVSRIGGRPAFLPSCEPELSSSRCKHCSSVMELLVQIWCPFEDSPMDRALYIWGCARGPCRGKDGRSSVRAWRGLRRNEAYATKLKKKLARKRELQKAKDDMEGEKMAMKLNPFSTSTSSAYDSAGLGSQIFGAPPPSEGTHSITEKSEASSDAESESSSSGSASLIVAIAAASLEVSPWHSAPSYPPLYLSTISEYVPSPPKHKAPLGVQMEVPKDEENEGGKAGWGGFELYENSLHVDQVFERFTRRVAYEGEQCVRYELDGIPLPFASDEVFDTLFPAPPMVPLPVTKPDFKVVIPQKRRYTSAPIPPCSICNSKRVFECQLMPNLINVLSSLLTNDKVMTDEERRNAMANALNGIDQDESRGMEWGTCLIFSCRKDCCMTDDGKNEEECWREEVVRIQWDR